MGRKIPGKRHKGVKDPEEQAERRLARVAGKINCPPSKQEQQVPKSTLQLMKYKNKESVKKGKKKKKGLLSTKNFITKDIDFPGMTRPAKNPEILIQNPGESNSSFMWRLRDSSDRAIREAMFEDQYKVQVKRHSETGEVVGLIKDKKTEADKIINEACNSSLPKKRRKREGVLSKHKKRKAKSVAKAELKSEQKKPRDFSDYKDEVKFGEIVHHPPNLTVLPKMKIKASAKESKPGQKSLLLKTMLEGTGEEKPLELSKKQKRALSNSIAQKKMLEEERIRVVNLYRLMKSKNHM